MARTAVTSTKLVGNTDTLGPAGVAVDIANGMAVTLGKRNRTVIVVTNTAAATKVVTVRKATVSFDNPASDFSSQAIPITTGITFMGPFGGRYVQADGTIFLDFVAGHTGVVYALEVPASYGP
jgi:hypothetical protein